MTQTQKIIKYCAIGFAIFLIVNIAAIIVGAIGAVSNIFDDDNKVLEKSKVLIENVSDVNTIDIDVSTSDILIKEGEYFKVETNVDSIKAKYKDGTISITDKTKKYDTKYETAIYVPKDSVLTRVNLNAGAGKIELKNITMENLNLNLGAGKFTSKEIKVLRKTVIDGGVGLIEFKKAELSNVKADLGVGKFSFNGKIIGINSIDAGIGDASFKLLDGVDNYSFTVSKGIGSIEVNGRSLSDNETYGDGINQVEVNGGIGSVTFTE